MFDFFLIPSDASEIDKASQLQNIFFAANILLVLLAAIAGSFVYYYGNKVIEAVKIDAQARFQSAVQRTEEIRSANLKLGLELEKERLARLELERHLAPRFITDKERQVIAEVIDLFPQHSIKIAAIGNPESVLYANQFAQLFEASSWRVEKIEGALLGPAQYGLFLLVAKEPGNAAQALIAALNKAGIVFKQQIDDRLKPDGIELRVGDKNPIQTR